VPKAPAIKNGHIKIPAFPGTSGAFEKREQLQINFQWHGEYGNKNEWGGEECSKK